jgi:hypothetical protein
MENKLNKLKTVIVTIRLDTNDYKIISGFAKKNLRSFNNQMRYVVGKYIMDQGLKSSAFGEEETDNKDDIF